MGSVRAERWHSPLAQSCELSPVQSSESQAWRLQVKLNTQAREGLHEQLTSTAAGMSTNNLEEARKSLERIQSFDTAKLAQEARLGETYNFKDAVSPAARVVRLFRQFPVEFLEELPDNQLSKLKAAADSFHNVLSQILEFNPKQENPNNAHTNLINTVTQQHQNIFNQIHDLIAYGASRQRDVAALEQDFRAAITRANDRAAEITKALADDQQEAQRILAEVRQVAAEQGVSQKAYYFAQESGDHDKHAASWRNWTIGTGVALGLYAAGSMFFHKWDWLAPSNTYETVQLALSKALIFIVLAYMLLLCARNFMAHKHNAIVNKHRQNALLTFQALADAAGAEEKRDIILTYAASCIFSPQETGYTKQAGTSGTEMPVNIIQALPKMGGSGST